jgi:hypothetical protein
MSRETRLKSIYGDFKLLLTLGSGGKKVRRSAQVLRSFGKQWNTKLPTYHAWHSLPTMSYRHPISRSANLLCGALCGIVACLREKSPSNDHVAPSVFFMTLHKTHYHRFSFCTAAMLVVTCIDVEENMAKRHVW